MSRRKRRGIRMNPGEPSHDPAAPFEQEADE
jgi:hypothetical protein